MQLKRTASLVAAALVAFSALAGASQAAMLDTSFGDGGVGIVGEGFPKQGARGLTIDSSGRLLVTGRGGGNGRQVYVGRVLDDGSPDSSFGTDGYALSGPTEMGGYPFGVTGLAPLVRANGRIVVAGTNQVGNGSGRYSIVTGFNGDGTIDSGWGVQGMIEDLDLLEATAIGQDSRNRVLVAGYGSWSYHGAFGDVARYRPSGRLDTSFVGDRRTRTKRPGHIRIPGGKEHPVTVSDMIMLGKRGMLVAGIYNGKFMVARLNQRGGFDNSFGRHGIATVDVEPGKNRPKRADCDECTRVGGMALTRDGKILVAGSSPYGRTPDTQRIVLMRFTSNGHLDRSFARGGIKIIHGGMFTQANDVTIQRDNKIVVVGNTGSGCAVMRFTTKGSFDSTFFGNGVFKTPVPGCANRVLIDHAGRIVAAGGGYTSADYPQANSSIIRILPNAKQGPAS